MDKRGQFFILGAMILMLALFVLVAKVNTYEEKLLLEDFPELTSNYKEEAPRVINDALLNGKDPTDSIDKFTKNYVTYARTIDPNLGIVYTYKDPKTGQVLVKNYYGNSIKLLNNNIFPTTEETANSIDLELGGTSFKKTVSTELSVYGKGYSEIVLDNDEPLNIEIDGILYPVDPNKENLNIISKSLTENGGVRVNIA